MCIFVYILFYINNTAKGNTSLMLNKLLLLDSRFGIIQNHNFKLQFFWQIVVRRIKIILFWKVYDNDKMGTKTIELKLDSWIYYFFPLLLY